MGTLDTTEGKVINTINRLKNENRVFDEDLAVKLFTELFSKEPVYNFDTHNLGWDIGEILVSLGLK